MEKTNKTLTTSALDSAYCNLVDAGWDPKLAYNATVGSNLIASDLLKGDDTDWEMSAEDLISACESLQV